MKHKGMIKIPSHTKEMVIKVTCDLCGIKGKYDQGEYEWETSENPCEFGNINRTIVRWKYGNEYPDGGHGELYDIQICSHCFHDRLLPWLKDQDANIKREEWDW